MSAWVALLAPPLRGPGRVQPPPGVGLTGRPLLPPAALLAEAAAAVLGFRTS